MVPPEYVLELLRITALPPPATVRGLEPLTTPWKATLLAAVRKLLAVKVTGPLNVFVFPANVTAPFKATALLMVNPPTAELKLPPMRVSVPDPRLPLPLRER